MCSVLGLVSKADCSEGERETRVGVGHSLCGGLEQERKPEHRKQKNDKMRIRAESERDLVFWLPAQDPFQGPVGRIALETSLHRCNESPFSAFKANATWS